MPRGPSGWEQLKVKLGEVLTCGDAACWLLLLPLLKLRPRQREFSELEAETPLGGKAKGRRHRRGRNPARPPCEVAQEEAASDAPGFISQGV